MFVEVMKSNVHLIPCGKYTDEQFEDVLEKYRKQNAYLHPGSTSSRVEHGCHIQLNGCDKLMIRRY